MTYFQHTTNDFLRPNGFVFSIKELPNTNFFCQAFMPPSVSLGVANQESSFSLIPHPGDKLAFSPFSIRFSIAEDMSNYIELFQWLYGLGFPDSHEDYNTLIRQRAADKLGSSRNAVERSDATLFILNSNNNPIKQINFEGAFPIAINMDEFDTTTTTLEYMTATATFGYRSFEFV